MDHYKERTETIVRRELIKTTCDKCGIEIPYEGVYNTRGFCLSFDKGESYGNDGNYKKGWEVEDLCDSCIEWLKNLLIENKVQLKKVESNW